jgi:TonB family protein
MKQGLGSLSERERETLRLLVRGHDSKSIASVLGLSIHTVNERLRDARRKLGVSSSREAARLLLAYEGGAAEKPGDEEIGVAAAPVDREDRVRLSEPAGARHPLVYAFLGGIMLIALISTLVALHPGDMGISPPPESTRARARGNLPSLITEADYPAEARAEGASGLVVFQLEVNAEGRVAACAITRSSGSAVLDATTCRIMISRARFAPATDAAGHAIPDVMRAGIRWMPPRGE